MTAPSRNVSLIRNAGVPWDTPEEALEYWKDPGAFLIERCSEFVAGCKVATNHILVATFFWPQSPKAAGGLILPDSVQEEDKSQGRVAILLKKGPLAWVDDERVKFGGTNYEVGEWLVFDRHDGRQTAFDRMHCRVMKDVDVAMSVTDPRWVY